MTTQQLEAKVTIGKLVSYGRREIEITYRGKKYKCTSVNTTAFDVINHEDDFFYTKKQALQALYDECKEKNNLK